jgi:hypothetical protein
LRRSLSEEILGIGSLPLSDPLLETSLDGISLKRKSANLLLVLDLLNLILELSEIEQLGLEVLKSGLLRVELSELVINSVLPEPVIFGEVIKEFHDSSSSTLNGTSQEKDNLNNFLISRNPSIEWISFGFRLVLLAPILDVLGRLKDVRGSSVDGSLDLIKGRLESAVMLFKFNIDLEEGLEDKLRHVSSTADSLFHLVKRVFRGMEKSLIHGPVIIFRELLDFFSGDRLDMLIELVGANGLDQILYSSFNLEVLGLKLLRLFLDPFLLHLDELIKSESLGILRKVNQDCLREGLKVVLNTILHDIVNVDDQLLKLSKALMNMVKIAIDVHGSPGKSNHTRSQFVLKILEMRNK